MLAVSLEILVIQYSSHLQLYVYSYFSGIYNVSYKISITVLSFLYVVLLRTTQCASANSHIESCCLSLFCLEYVCREALRSPPPLSCISLIMKEWAVPITYFHTEEKFRLCRWSSLPRHHIDHLDPPSLQSYTWTRHLYLVQKQSDRSCNLKLK